MIARLLDHTWRIKSLLLILLGCAWYLHVFPLCETCAPTRPYILVNVAWKLTAAMIFFHIARHEMFGYCRLGMVVQDYREAMQKKEHLKAIAASLMAVAYCILFGLFFFAIVPTVTQN